MKKVFALILALILTLSLVACSTTDSKDTNTPASDTAADTKQDAAPTADTEAADNSADAETKTPEEVGKKSIVLLVKNLNNSFWIEMSDAAKARCAELGWDLQVLAPIETDNNEQQIQLIEQSLINPPDL